MTRKFLLDLGIEKKVVDEIMEEHGHTVETIKEKIATKKDVEIEKLQSQVEKLNINNEKLKTAKEELENQSNNNEWEKKYKELETKLADELTAQQKELETKAKELETKETLIKDYESQFKKNALRSVLKNDGVSEKLIKLVENKFDLDKLEMDGENIKNYDVVAEPVKKEFPDIFTNVEQAGFLPNVPNVTNENLNKVYTMEQIKALTPEQINENWDKGIKQAIEKGI